jgi:hypothetical protein
LFTLFFSAEATGGEDLLRLNRGRKDECGVPLVDLKECTDLHSSFETMTRVKRVGGVAS